MAVMWLDEHGDDDPGRIRPPSSVRSTGRGRSGSGCWAGARWQSTAFVFTSRIGTPLDDRNVRKAFSELLSAAKLPHIRIHDLRHTCASLLLAQGVHARVVMETLGHSQVSFTLDTYSHVLPALQQDAAAQMQQALG